MIVVATAVIAIAFAKDCHCNYRFTAVLVLRVAFSAIATLGVATVAITLRAATVATKGRKSCAVSAIAILSAPMVLGVQIRH